jgi:uncharacterized phiE125 gp8 family phage protein
MALKLKTAPTVEPISVDDAKKHIRLEVATDDAYVGDLIKAARLYLERATGRSLITQTWQLTLDKFPPYCDAMGVVELPFLRDVIWSLPYEVSIAGSDAIRLVRGYVQSITSITYVDRDGVTQTMDPTLYQVDTSAPIARLVPSFGNSWPVTRDQIAAVVIEYKAGFGDTAATVPPDLVHAIRQLLAYWYDGDRSAVIEGRMAAPADHSLDAVISSYRVLQAKPVAA